MKTTPFIILTVFLVLLPGALLRANPVIVDYPTTGVYADNDLTPIGGPWATGDNTISLTDFVTLVGDANSEGSGGVVTFEEDLSSSSQLGTTLEGFNAWFDNSSFYLPVLLVGTQPGVLRVSEAMHGARDPVSGLQYLAAEYTTPQMATITWEFGDVRDSSHNPVENFGLRSVGFTMITRDDTSRVVQGIVHFSDGSSEAVTVDAAASNHPDGHVFFGFVAPSGLYIDRVVMGNDGLYGYDDFGFSTVIKPASSTVTHLEPSALDWYKGRSADAITVDTNVDTVLWTTNADVPAHLINYFPAVTVDEDETFTLTVEFTTGTISSTNSTFRFGVFDSSSTQIASDFNSNHRSQFEDDRGYSLSYHLDGSTGVQVRGRSGSDDRLLQPNIGDVVSHSVTGSSPGLESNTDYTLTVSLNRSSAGYEQDFQLVGGNTDVAISGSLDDVSDSKNVSSFDQFAMMIGDGTVISSILITGMRTSISNGDTIIANDDFYWTFEDVVMEVVVPGVLENDISSDPGSLFAVKVSDPIYGLLSLNSDGSFLYTPPMGFVGVDSFTYAASDGEVFSEPAVVEITVLEMLQPITGAVPIWVSATDFQEGYPPENVMKGNFDSQSRWSSDLNGVQLEFDLGSDKRISAVKIAWLQSHLRVAYFDLQVKEESDSTWTTVISGGESSGASPEDEFEVFDFSDVDARFVRYIGYGNSDNAWNSIIEFAIIEAMKPTDLIAESASLTLELDLGEDYSVSEVNITWWESDHLVALFDIDVKGEEDSNWTNVISDGASSGESPVFQFENFAFAERDARYVRYIDKGNSEYLWNSVLDFVVKGRSLTDPDPGPDPDPDPPPSGTIISFPGALRLVNVSNASQLQAALNSAIAGDHIILADGVYGGSNFSISASGSSANPIVIRATTLHGARLTRDLAIDGSHVWIHGLFFDNARVRVGQHQTTNAFTATRCRWSNQQSTGIGLRLDSGMNHRIHYCEWRNWGGRGISTSGNPRAPHIYRCLFRDTPPGFSTNATEALQIGFGRFDFGDPVGALIEECRFYNWNSDDETISIKSSNNHVLRSTFENCDGRVQMRGGSYNTFEALWLDGVRALQVHGKGGMVLGCRVRNSTTSRGIATAAGNLQSDSENEIGHPRAENTVIAGCDTDRMLIGVTSSGWNLPALNTIVRDTNVIGTISYGNHSGSDVQPGASGSQYEPWADLIYLSNEDVGPNATHLPAY